MVVSYLHDADDVWLALRLGDVDGEHPAALYLRQACCILSVIL